jgi:hypothetical protein
MNKLSSPDDEVKQQHTWLSFKAWMQQRELLTLLFRRLNLNEFFENLIDLRKSQYHFGMVVTAHMAYVEYTCNVRSHTECLRRHPISECSASTPDRRRRPGSAPGPPAPALRRLGPPPARSSSNSESSEPQLPSIAPRWPHFESLGPECATTWPALSRSVALRSSIAGVSESCCADGCLPSYGRARAESVSASCAMVVWALSMVLKDLPFSHWTHVTFTFYCLPHSLGHSKCLSTPW